MEEALQAVQNSDHYFGQSHPEGNYYANNLPFGGYMPVESSEEDTPRAMDVLGQASAAETKTAA